MERKTTSVSPTEFIGLWGLSESDSIAVSPIPAVNVASVPQRSPLRYPGGKTWLIPHIRAWFKSIDPSPCLLIEPFAGGGIVSLTALMEGLAERCLMAELDRDVAALWHACLRHGPRLCEKILRFKPTREAVNAISGQYPRDVIEHGFRTLVLNRTRAGRHSRARRVTEPCGGKRQGNRFTLVSRDNCQPPA